MMTTDNWYRDQQALSKHRRGCLDAHLISEVMVKMCKETCDKALRVAYIDFRKAYDSVSHKALQEILERTLSENVKPIKQRLLNTVKLLMNRWRTVLDNVESKERNIPIKREIFQRDKMSPTLFCIALTILKAQRQSTVTARDGDKYYKVDKVCYMDDIKVFGEDIYHLDRKVRGIKRLSKMIGLEFNESKSGVVTDVEKSELKKTTTLKEFPIVGRGGNKAYKYLASSSCGLTDSQRKKP